MIVDIHAHYSPREYNETLIRIGGRSLPEAARAATACPMRHDAPDGISERLRTWTTPALIAGPLARRQSSLRREAGRRRRGSSTYQRRLRRPGEAASGTARRLRLAAATPH